MQQVERNRTDSRAPVLILGSGANIGLGLARALIADGRPVILTYHRTPEPVVELEMDHPDLVRGVLPLHVEGQGDIARLFARVAELTDRLAAVIDCIGPIVYTSLLATAPEDFERVVQGNLMQFFATAKGAHPLLKLNGGGRLIVFTMAGLEKLGAYKTVAAYAAAKAGVLSLVRSLAVQWAGDRITVNAIAPGIVARLNDLPDDTDILGDPDAGDPQAFMRPKIPAGRLTHIGDLTHALRFLLSDEAAMVTGQNLTVSGGFGWGDF